VVVAAGATTGILCTVTFKTSYGAAPYVVITPSSATAGAANAPPFVTAAGDGTSFSLRANGTALADNTYTWNYVVIG
jgi:hypothetical protein